MFKLHCTQIFGWFCYSKLDKTDLSVKYFILISPQECPFCAFVLYKEISYVVLLYSHSQPNHLFLNAAEPTTTWIYSANWSVIVVGNLALI